MNYILRVMIIITLLGVFGTDIYAEIIRTDSYSEGVIAARDNNTVLVVFVYGSDWNKWGVELYDYIFKSPEFEKSLPKEGIVFSDVDILQSPGEDEKKRNDVRNQGWRGDGVYTYPAVCVYASDGNMLGVCQGKALSKSLENAGGAIVDIINLARRYSHLKKEAVKLRADNEVSAELAVLIEIGKMPLNRPDGLLERIKELDPNDLSGDYARLSFPHWNTLLANTTQKTQGGHGDEAESGLKEMLKCKAYTDDQVALIHVALGTCYRLQKGHEKEASEAFVKAVEVSPGSFGSQMARRILNTWYDINME